MDAIPIQRLFARFHLALYQRTGGRLGRRLSGATSLVLTTTGRKTGQPRSTVLVYARRGDELVVVASNYGGERPPAWLLNIRDQPAVEVLAGPPPPPERSRPVTRPTPSSGRWSTPTTTTATTVTSARRRGGSRWWS